MNQIVIVLGLFLTLNAAAQIELPYFQPFEDENFWDQYGDIGMQVATSLIPTGTDINAFPCPPDLSFKECYYQRVLNAKGYSWELSSKHQDKPNKRSLKLTVHNGDIPYMGGPAEGRTRAEIIFITPNENSIYVKWELFIPNDEEFIETLVGTSYHKLFQLKPHTMDSSTNTPYDIDPFGTIAALDLIYSEDASAKRDLYFWVDPPSIVRDRMNGIISEEYRLSNRKRMKINEGIEKGKWNQILLKISPSSQSNGYFQFWINHKPVVLDGTDVYTDPNYSVPYVTFNTSLNNDETLSPFKLFVENIVVTNITKEPVPYGLKFGHYRKPQTTTQSMYIDGLSITNEMPPFTAIATKLKNRFCGAILPIEDLILECDEVAGALNYKFKFESVDSNEEIFINSSSTAIDIRNDERFSPNKTYRVRVRAQGNSFDFDYGEVCEITIPSYTKLKPIFCGNTRFVNSSISCYHIPGSQGYKFRFTNKFNQSYWIDSYSNEITIPNDPFFDVEGEFVVHVREINFDYNDPCSITIKKSSISSRSTNYDILNRNDENINLYPNPIFQFLIIPEFDENIEVNIYDMMGKQVYKEKVLKGQTKINIENLSSGTYLLKVITSKNIFQSKILKR